MKYFAKKADTIIQEALSSFILLNPQSRCDYIQAFPAVFCLLFNFT